LVLPTRNPEEPNFHPHLHGALADGIFYPDGTFQRFAVIDQGALVNALGVFGEALPK
jgi:hypothetical protein